MKWIKKDCFAKNHNSSKKCSQCIYYIEEYKDDYTLRFFGYGKVKIRPACGYSNTYDFISHNPARTCQYYERKGVICKRKKKSTNFLNI